MSSFQLKHVPHAAVDILIRSMRLVMCLHVAVTDNKDHNTYPMKLVDPVKEPKNNKCVSWQ
jgi:hypothetical protein